MHQIVFGDDPYVYKLRFPIRGLKYFQKQNEKVLLLLFNDTMLQTVFLFQFLHQY